jgi:hemoglobin
MQKRTLQPLCDKIGHDRIKHVIHAFYSRLQADDQLGHFFAHIEDFSSHEARIADFWYTAMGGRLENPPQVDMVGKHFPLGIQDADIDRWLEHFRTTTSEHLEPGLAEQWVFMAEGIAGRLRQIVVHQQLR